MIGFSLQGWQKDKTQYRFALWHFIFSIFLVDIFRIFIFALFFGAEWVPRNLLFIKDLVAIWNEYLVGYYVSEKWNRRAQV